MGRPEQSRREKPGTVSGRVSGVFRKRTQHAIQGHSEEAPGQSGGRRKEGNYG